MSLKYSGKKPSSTDLCKEFSSLIMNVMKFNVSKYHMIQNLQCDESLEMEPEI